jgi:UDPglucose--hexose-1-phosphate uridylyltransferase
MSDLRRNPITGLWVIVAENRGDRPQEIVFGEQVRSGFACPFCEGQEHRTPGETLALRAPGSKPDGPGWRVRVIPNKYPALEGAAGLHEVIVESPRHIKSVTELDDSQFADVLEVYQRRFAALRHNGGFAHVSLFKNSATLGGATLAHVHSQLIATKSPAAMPDTRAANFRRFSEQSGKCPACEMQAEEALLVHPTEHFIAVCPAAARFAYEIWILPREHRTNFDDLSAAEHSELACLFRAMLVKLERIIKVPAYNYFVHSAPFDTGGCDHYHWHIEILPRITTLGGFEVAGGCYINAVSPERAAAVLRDA